MLKLIQSITAYEQVETNKMWKIETIFITLKKIIISSISKITIYLDLFKLFFWIYFKIHIYFLEGSGYYCHK